MRILFRTVAIAEAFSWLGLLVGMFIKYVLKTSELGVEIFGPIHGAIFIAYVAVTIVAAVRFRWRWWVTLLGLAASIPPFFTVIFDVWVERTGRLRAADRAA